MQWGEFTLDEEQTKQYENLCTKDVQELAAIIVIGEKLCVKCAHKQEKIDKYRKAMTQKSEELNNQRKKLDDMISFMKSRRVYYNYLHATKRKI